LQWIIKKFIGTVRKGNPAKQGLKRQQLSAWIQDNPVRKGNPAKQGLKRKEDDTVVVYVKSEKEIQQNKD